MSPPWTGALQTLEDVVVERVSGREIWVVGSMPARLDERLVLEMPGDGSTRGVGVRVVESVPVLTDDVLRHRLRLEVTDAGAAPSAGGNDRTGGR